MHFSAFARSWDRMSSRGGFKAESLVGHITRRASPLPPLPCPSLPPLPSPSLPSLFSPTLSFPFPPAPPLLSPPPFPSLPLRSMTPLIQLGVSGSAVSSPSGVWGGAPAEIEFGALNYDIWLHVMWQQCCTSSTSSTVRVLGGSAARLQLGSRP